MFPSRYLPPPQGNSGSMNTHTPSGDPLHETVGLGGPSSTGVLSNSQQPGHYSQPASISNSIAYQQMASGPGYSNQARTHPEYINAPVYQPGMPSPQYSPISPTDPNINASADYQPQAHRPRDSSYIHIQNSNATASGGLRTPAFAPSQAPSHDRSYHSVPYDPEGDRSNEYPQQFSRTAQYGNSAVQYPSSSYRTGAATPSLVPHPLAPPLTRPTPTRHQSYYSSDTPSSSGSGELVRSQSYGKMPPSPDPQQFVVPVPSPTGQARPHVCESCGLSFVRGHDLKRHKDTHSNAKPHVCDCGKSFTRKDALKRHIFLKSCPGGKGAGSGYATAEE